jgi:tight adherence protein C
MVLFLTVITVSFLTKAAIFGCVAVAAWLLLDLLAVGGSRAEKRLEEFNNSRTGREDRAKEWRLQIGDATIRLLEKAFPHLSKPLQPKNDRDTNRLRDRLNQAGFRSESAPTIFLGLKTLSLITGLFVGGGFTIFSNGMTQSSIMIMVATGGVSFYLPTIVVWLRKRSRQNAIFFGLPDTLDLMVVCVEAGLGLDQAMRKVVEEMKNSYAVIAEEFTLCNLQLQMGRARNEVLHELGTRTGVDDLKALAAILIQADKFGSSIAQALRVQSDSMRVRRRQTAEEKAAKTAVKLIFPLVLFIFPAIFVVLVGPAAITMVNEMFPAMSGGK